MEILKYGENMYREVAAKKTQGCLHKDTNDSEKVL